MLSIALQKALKVEVRLCSEMLWVLFKCLTENQKQVKFDCVESLTF